MEWDLSRVFTAKDADEVKVGSKVICAFTLKDLMTRVEEHHENITEVERILPSSQEHRFNVYTEDGFFSYPICYLVSESEEKKLKWTDLKIGDVIRRKGEIRMVTGISTVSDSSEMHIYNGTNWLTDEVLEEWEKVAE